MITEIAYNWFFTKGCGEDYMIHKVGSGGTIEIREHRPAGEGDRLFYDVINEDGKTERIFNPNKVTFK